MLITNVDVWDGRSDSVSKGLDVLIEGNLVKKVAKGIAAPKAHKVDGQGGTVIPGLIDMHAHHAIHEGMLEGRNSCDQMAIGPISGLRLREYLDQGFTSSLDAGRKTRFIIKLPACCANVAKWQVNRKSGQHILDGVFPHYPV